MASATVEAPRGNDRVARRAQLVADQEQKLDQLLVNEHEEQLGGSLQDGPNPNPNPLPLLLTPYPNP